MAMTPEASIDRTSIVPETQTPIHQHRQYHSDKQQQEKLLEQQYLQTLQQNSLYYDYCFYCQHDSNHEQNASSSKQQSTSLASVLSSPKLKFRESLRESFRDLYVPKIWSNLRKSASEISLVLEAMRYGPSLTYLETHGISSSKRIEDMDGDNAPRSISDLPVQKRKRYRAKIMWQNYSPHHLNKQIQYEKQLLFVQTNV